MAELQTHMKSDPRRGGGESGAYTRMYSNKFDLTVVLACMHYTSFDRIRGSVDL